MVRSRCEVGSSVPARTLRSGTEMMSAPSPTAALTAWGVVLELMSAMEAVIALAAWSAIAWSGAGSSFGSSGLRCVPMVWASATMAFERASPMSLELRVVAAMSALMDAL